MAVKIKLFLTLVIFSIIVSCNNLVYSDLEVGSNPAIDECNLPIAPVYLPGDYKNGRVTGQKNCRPFSASAYANLYNSGGLTGIRMIMNTSVESEPFPDIKEWIGIAGMSINTGTYQMYNENTGEHLGFYFILYDFDSPEANFRIDSLFPNEITFTNVNLEEGVAEGYFTCQFLLRSQIEWGINPDTVQFKDCHFTTKIIE